MLGICHLSHQNNFVYLLDETFAGEKDSDHVCSQLSHFIDYKVYGHARLLKMYLDSAAYFKCRFLVWWTSEQIFCGRFSHVVLSYMVPGHTKFHPDALFSSIAHPYYKSDVFNTQEPAAII